MKFLYLITLLLFFGEALGQESLKKRYCVPSEYGSVKLKKEVEKEYDKMTEEERKEVRKKIPVGHIITYTNKETVEGKTVIVSNKTTINKEFYSGKKFKINEDVDFKYFKKYKANVKFDEENGILYINPWLIKYRDGSKYKGGETFDSSGDKDIISNKYKNRNQIFFFKLENRQGVKLSFSEGVVTSFAIPIKYRFKGKDGLDEDFTSSFNINIFAGWAWGKTSFFHKKKVGHTSNTWKFNIGIIAGTSTVTLNSNNTSLDLEPLDPEKEIIKGLASLGSGATYSFNKINFGLFLGNDYGVGRDANKWNYNKKPWLGVGLGYSLFKL